MIPALERAIGRLLHDVRAGDEHLACNAPGLCDRPASIRLTSPAFADGAMMPQRLAGARLGDNLSPPLEWANLPPASVELALVMQDPDAPLPRPVTHLIVVGIAPERPGFAEGELAAGAGETIRFGEGFRGRIGYAGPGPVRGHGPHRYVFQVFALVRRIAVPPVFGIDALVAAMRGSVLAKGSLTGVYEQA